MEGQPPTKPRPLNPEAAVQIPVIQGVIERRILVNYRVDPAVLAAQLPAPFRPQLVDGWAMAGICRTSSSGRSR